MFMDNNNEDAQDFFQPEAQEAGADSAPSGVAWTASEYIEHTKDGAWYMVAVGVTAVLAGLGYLVSRDLFTPSAVVALGLLLIAVSNRKPRTLQYQVDSKGIVIGNKRYTYDDFQSFSIIQEGPIESVLLLPQKRWSPTINLYFSPDDGQKIFDVLSAFLPFEQREKDMIDKFLHKIRF